MNSLLISFLSIEIISTFRGLRRGIRGMVYGIATWVIMILLIPSLALSITHNLEKQPKVRDKIEDIIDPYVDAVTMNVLDENSAVFNTDTDALKQYFQNFVGTEEQLEQYEKYVLGESDDPGYSYSQGSTFSFENGSLEQQAHEEAKDTLVEYSIYIMSVVISYILIKIGLAIASSLINSSMKQRLRTSADNIGLLWGIAEGVLYIFVILMIISTMQHTGVGKHFMSMVTENTFIKYMYENNIIQKLFMAGP
ncbi:YrzE family protein [Butyrivibrio sp. WCD3002]|uniref:YrzE family protein n=1 Tax=Butyrivibrio sp. WCD3002 TaxID=1280676 RepID=UPI000478C86B